MRPMWFVSLVVIGFALIPSPSRAADAACKGANIWPAFEDRHPELAREINERARRMPHGEGRLFRISKAGKPVSYVLGTVHIYDSRYIPLSPGIVRALSATRMTALELKDVNNLSLFDGQEGDIADGVLQVLAESGRRPIDFLDEDEKKLVLETAGTREVPGPLMLTMRPALLATWLSSGNCAPERGKPGIDQEVARLSLKDHKLVVGLETAEEQLASINNLPFEIQKEALRIALRTLQTRPDMLETTIQFYTEGKIGQLVAMVYDDIPQIQAEYGTFPKAYYQALIDDRNQRMRDRALPYLDINSVFIAVGAAHLPGERGLLKLLENAGYGVEKVE